MYRSITYSESDYYLNYLNISAHYVNNNRFCNGKFFSYMEKSFGIKKLPYDIKLLDLVKTNESMYELFVELPVEYFNEWERYPILGYANRHEDNKIRNASYYDILIHSVQDEQLSDLIHPYDTTLRDTFLKSYKVDKPKDIITYQHPNGRDYRPYEFYLSYWRSYIVFEVINNCKFIERYLNKEKGKKYIEEEYKRVNDFWVSKYGNTFNRLATYRTVKSRLVLSQADINCSYGEICTFLFNHLDISGEELESDMTLLLELYSDWENKLKYHGLTSYNMGLEQLKKDIYFLFEWLCISGVSERDLLEKWSYKNRQTRSWSQLQDVLDFEEIKFNKSFKQYIPSYSQSINKWLEGVNLEQIYLELESLDSFYPWIRGFYDLHETLNNKKHIHLIQPRILDNLLVVTIRTEIIIKDLLLSKFYCQEDDLKKVFLRLSECIENNEAKAIFKSVSDKQNWKMTELRERPEDIFEKVDSCSVGKSWSSNQKYFFSQILKFVTSRNYFAHHSYKDDELNEQINELCRSVFISCLHTVLYLISLSKNA
ncbi:hypothetical protein ACPD1L_001392 [Vibrio cholerae]